MGSEVMKVKLLGVFFGSEKSSGLRIRDGCISAVGPGFNVSGSQQSLPLVSLAGLDGMASHLPSDSPRLFFFIFPIWA